MANINIYIKKGNTSKKEKQYIKELQKFLDANPDADIKPAKTLSQLKKNFEKYCVSDVEFTETTTGSDTDEDVEKQLDEILEKSQTEKEHTEFRDGLNVENDEIVDPFNRNEPIVRDYVTSEDKFAKEGDGNNKSTGQTSFAEPTNFRESFSIPGDEEDQKQQSQNSGQSSAGNTDKKKEKAPPFNPAAEEMSAGKKKKAAKRLAEAVVFGTCFIAEKGAVWYATKDVKDSVINDHIRKGRINPDVLLEKIDLDKGQQATIKEWFAIHIQSANDLLKVSEAGKEKLVESLTVVLMEKGVVLTPIQELAIDFVMEVALPLGVTAFALQQSANGIVKQLMVMTKNGVYSNTEDQPHQEVNNDTPPVQTQTEQTNTAPQQATKEVDLENEGHFDQLAIGESRKTKE